MAKSLGEARAAARACRNISEHIFSCREGRMTNVTDHTCDISRHFHYFAMSCSSCLSVPILATRAAATLELAFEFIVCSLRSFRNVLHAASEAQH